MRAPDARHPPRLLIMAGIDSFRRAGRQRKKRAPLIWSRDRAPLEFRDAPQSAIC